MKPITAERPHHELNLDVTRSKSVKYSIETADGDRRTVHQDCHKTRGTCRYKHYCNRGAFKLSPAAFGSLLSSHLPEQLISKEDISRQDTAVAPLCAENRGVKMQN